MLSFPSDVVEAVLSRHKQEGVELISSGNPRDGFMLPIEVPHWTSGFGGNYEMVHTNVPAGTMIAVGDLSKLDTSNQDVLKEQLRKIDIYPTGHSGDFTGKDVKSLQKWFFDRSLLDNEANNQTAIACAKQLTADGLGQDRYNDLVQYLANEMNLFKDPKNKGALVPADESLRKLCVKSLLDGLSKTVRYTRVDEPANAFQLVSQTHIETVPGGGEASFNLESNLILVDRLNKKGAHSFSPLNREMLGHGWVIRDHQPLGERGRIDVSELASEAAHRGKNYLRFDGGKPSLN